MKRAVLTVSLAPALVLGALAQTPGTTDAQRAAVLPVHQSSQVSATGTSTPTDEVSGTPTAGGRIDFGITPDDGGGSLGPFPGRPGLPLTTQFQQGHRIVFGAAVDKGVPPTTLVSDAACTNIDRSSGAPEYMTDWWCQFIDRAGVRHGVPIFSAEVCFINSPIGTTLMEAYDNDCTLIASAANTTTGAEVLTVVAPPGTLIAYVRVISSVDPAGLSVDCLDFPDPLPRQAPETGLVLVTAYAECNAGFIQGSATTRTMGTGPCPVPQVCPFPLPMPALPGGRTPVFDVIVWNFLSDLTPGTDTIIINGSPITGSLIGSGTPDLCWGKINGVAYGAIVSPGTVIYGGVNSIDSACDGQLTGDPASLGEGVTIVTVYDSNTTSGPVRIIDIAWGYSSTQSSGTGNAMATVPLTCGYGGGPARLLVNALDGQLGGGDLFRINGVDVSGVFPGTNAPGDAWIGLSGPCPTDNLYDVGHGNAQPWMSHGDTSIRLEHVGLGDCIGMSLAVVEHAAYDTACFGCQTTRYCNPPTSPNNLAGINIDHCLKNLAGTCDNFVTLVDGPPGQFTYLLVGDMNGIVTNPPGAIGDLCVIGGCISRFIADAGAIGPNGVYATNIANSASGGVYGLPATCGGTMDRGETWYFQYWHRDGMNPSRFSEAMCVLFQ